MSVTFEQHDDIALALVDRPPVNAIDAGVRAGLCDAVRKSSNAAGVKALVIACRGRTFLSGADLSELGGTIPPPGYGETLTTLENCPLPVIAVIHGTALGGGLEIAMACHFRAATASARMGMPEITLGILPGAGGTQRLPRLTGPREALELLISGAPVTASRARELGLIDEIVGEDVISEGLQFARRLLAAHSRPRRTRDLAIDASLLDRAAIDAVLERHARALRGRSTQHVIVRALQAACELPFDRGVSLEAELSAASLETPESRALRHVFFAERECGRIPGITSTARAEAPKRAAVIGAGTMGSGIAMALADSGIPTRLVERDAAALARGIGLIRDNYTGAVQRGRLDQATADARIALIEGTVDFEAARDASIAIEAVFEDFALKREVLARLDEVLPAHAIIASNTSSLSLTELAAATRRPAQVIGLHFFSPANVMRLLEIVRGEHTGQDTILAGLALARMLRKTGVVVGDGFGFVGNRMMLDGYFREAELMLLQGVAPERIDAAMEQFGFAMGPNKVNDMAGIDVGTRVRAELARREPRDPPYHVVSDALTGLGRLGQKSGKGIYRYEPGDRTPRHDPELAGIVSRLAATHAIAPREVDDAEIIERCVLSLVNIGADLLAEGRAYRASDIDVVWTSGYGFPRWRGGPMFHADTLGLGNVVERIRALATAGGGSYWRVSPLLLELAGAGRTFADWDRGRRG
jgi:3-hydroxyacyl-CoA dehydrogenase